MSKPNYVRISKVPADLRWDVPQHNQGQIVEVAYADAHPSADEACAGSEYQRVTDRSDGEVTYYQLAPHANDARAWDRLSAWVVEQAHAVDLAAAREHLAAVERSARQTLEAWSGLVSEVG